ncbi:hypothetical protein [Streptomyces sp. CdTB01]|uniref:hypothetical protein n=1 Tax=Streptomyces sp. CdTB01 TaxID=1725411 RepID=UPI00073AC2D1|nr:hypothetical protein [Streptomyces sp. CdTB01]ALV31265.1 hypothetical protein AS200_03745 [Streptomyces sp. CdTB01]
MAILHDGRHRLSAAPRRTSTKSTERHPVRTGQGPLGLSRHHPAQGSGRRMASLRTLELWPLFPLRRIDLPVPLDDQIGALKELRDQGKIALRTRSSQAPGATGQLTRPGGPLDRVAPHLGGSLSQAAPARLLRRSPVVLPIPGPSMM